MIILLSILESIYVVYMLRYFKTTQSLIFNNNINITKLNLFSYLKHNEYNTNTPQHHICQFGRDGSILIAIYLLLRSFYLYRNMKWNWQTNKIIIFIIFLISLINMNAVIYLIPFYITELYINIVLQ